MSLPVHTWPVGKALFGAAQCRIHVAAGFAILVNGEAHWPSKCAAAGREVMIRSHSRRNRPSPPGAPPGEYCT